MSFANERLFYLALLLAVMPLWLSRFLPGVDLPAQAAQATALLEIWCENPLFIEHFEIHLLTPYLTGTMLLALLSYVMPVGVAVKLVMSAVVIATPILAGRILDANGGDSRFRWLIIPSTYSFAFYWGFLPFVIAVPIGLGLLLLTVRLHRKPSIGLGVFIAFYTIFLFFSHLLVLCFSSLVALAWLAGSNYRQLTRLAALSIPYIAPLPLIAVWIFQTMSNANYMTPGRIVFGSFLKRLLDIPVQSTGLDGEYFTVSILIFAIIIALPFISRLTLTKRPEKWLMVLTGFAMFILLPTFGMGTAFLYDRFGLFLPILWFVLWEKTSADTSRWHWLGIFAVFVWAGVNILRFSAFNLETNGFEKLMAETEPGKRMLSMVATHRSSQFTAPMFLHFPSWYQAVHRGIVDFNFGMSHVTVVRYKSEMRPAIADAIAWNPGDFEWQKNRGDDYDYFVVRSHSDVSAEIFKDHRSSVTLIANEKWWWLYRKIE